MKRFQKIGVFLNGSPADDAVLSFGGRIAEIAGSEQVHAVHFREHGEGWEEAEPTEDQFAGLVKDRLPEAIAGRTTCAVRPGVGVREVLTTARDQDLDLVVVGRRLPHSQLAIGSAFMKLARKAPCDVLVVPEQSQAHLARILVPVDFSKHAGVALQTAVELVRGTGEAHLQIICQHVFACGYGYKRVWTSLAEAVQEMKTRAREEYDEFIRTVDTQGIEIEAILTVSEQRAEVIADLAVARKMDLVLLGSRGRTFPAAGLLGATAERILVFSAVPVLVVKEKGETSRFLDAFLS